MVQELPNFDTVVGRLLLGVTGLPWTWLGLIVPALVLLYQVGYGLLQIRHSCQYFPILVVIPYRHTENQWSLRDPPPSPHSGPFAPLRR